MRVRGKAIALAAALAAFPVWAHAQTAFNWTGFYFGANAGYGWSSIEQSQTSGGMPPGPFDLTSNLYSLQAHAGYNVQTGPIVFGAELSGGWNQAGTDDRIASSNPAKYQAVNLRSGFAGEATAKAGFAFDRMLVYAKGGYAAHFAVTFQQTTNPGYSTQDSDQLKGWVFGGGAEVALSPTVLVRLEYLRYDFGRVNGLQTSVSDPPIGFVYTNSSKVEIDSVKLGVSVKLN